MSVSERASERERRVCERNFLSLGDRDKLNAYLLSCLHLFTWNESKERAKWIQTTQTE